MNTDYTAKITEIFYSVDEFCKQIEPQFKKKAIGEDGKKRRNRAFEMSDSEIITILILFHLSGYRTLKAFYTQMICKEGGGCRAKASVFFPRRVWRKNKSGHPPLRTAIFRT